MRDQVTRIAVNEVLNQSFEITKQFLATNKVVLKDGIPIVADVIFSENEEDCEVYFPIVDEEYYFVVYIDMKPTPSLRFMGMSAGNKVYFYAVSEHESAEKLVNLSGVSPTRKWEKGDEIPFIKSYRCYKDSGFEYLSTDKMTGEVEDKLDKILDTLIKYKDNVKELSKIADMGINVCYLGYKEQMWGINFKKENVRKLAELELTLDIDLYASGPDLPCE